MLCILLLVAAGFSRADHAAGVRKLGHAFRFAPDQSSVCYIYETTYMTTTTRIEKLATAANR